MGVPDRRKSLEELEGERWGEPTFDSYLVTTCHRLRKKPVGEFTVEDLRIMIGQQIGLPFLVPIAVEVLAQDPLAQGDFYPGDLLKMVISVPDSFWADRRELRDVLVSVLLAAQPFPEDVDETGQEFLANG